VHGLCRLRDDPGLESLASKVYQGRKSQHILRAAKIQATHPEREMFPNDDQLCWGVGHDVFLSNPSPTLQLSYDEIDTFLECIEEGKRAEQQLCQYRDKLISTINPSPPNDATLPERQEATTNTTYINHPCFSYCTKDGQYGMKPDIYPQLVDRCLRHQHNLTYCIRHSKCRFNFPRPIYPETRVYIKEIPYKCTEKRGKLKERSK